MKKFDVNNMQLKIQSPGFDLTPELVKYSIIQIEKLGKVFSGIKKCEMTLRKEKNNQEKDFVAEAKLFVPREVLFALEHESNFKVALKNMFDDLEGQLLKFKEKIQEKNPTVYSGAV